MSINFNQKGLFNSCYKIVANDMRTREIYNRLKSIIKDINDLDRYLKNMELFTKDNISIPYIEETTLTSVGYHLSMDLFNEKERIVPEIVFYEQITENDTGTIIAKKETAFTTLLLELAIIIADYEGEFYNEYV